ncbi:hypothetical protein [Nocardia puris]|uniref:Uncharacterized protein n=1 Tax=Nocardia puris TaxID=208602 RepID=A0A366D2K6_9NOCA|nr:hypothetical protein [Nocardia puris]RBO84300.1 hypothetical protein DFR74_117121 [Nocardia puris]
MSTWLNLLLAGIAGVAAIALLVSVMVMATSLSRDPDSVSPDRLAPDRNPGSTQSPADAASPIWPSSWTHDAPKHFLTPDEAHRDMQIHRLCRLDGCARKAVAFQVLIEAGRVVPDSGRMTH